MLTNQPLVEFHEAVLQHLRFLYPAAAVEPILEELLGTFDGFQSNTPEDDRSLWSEQDAVLITYGDSVIDRKIGPLKTLNQFLDEHIGDVFSSVHVLPFSPYSSDDGFAVIDYRKVNALFGTWDDLSQIASKYRLMADLVINHVSSESVWFQNFCRGEGHGHDYFIETCPEENLSAVVRPRTSPLLRPTRTIDGEKHVWCTFSHDQIDLNFSNPGVLLEFLRIIRLYLEKGVSVFRLDAVGFLWKEPGTTCMHLPQTHEVIRLLRMLLDHFAPGTILITETNVPNHENLSYFGNRNEAHIVYNFSLAPLVVHALLTGYTEYLKRWMMSMPPAPVGCTYLNFTASHDGIGMRPAEGLLSEKDQADMTDAIRRFGGLVSSRRMSDGTERTYELNVSLFDAMMGTLDGPDDWQVERFLCSQTVMMAVEGIPAFYIHSLLSTENYHEGVQQTGHNRTINRRKRNYRNLSLELQDSESRRYQVFEELKRRLRIRCGQPAFHPNATQFTLQPGAPYFAFWRQSVDRTQSVFAIHNMTNSQQDLRLTDLNLISLDSWYDLLTDNQFPDINATLRVQPYQCLWITNRSTVAS